MIDLKDVICRYPECVQDGKKLKSLLSDLYPSENLYASILCSMLDDGIVDEIKGKDTIDKLTFTNLSSRIEAKHGYAQKYIDGCLTIWANAYDIKIASAQDVEKIVPIIKLAPKEKQIDATIHTHKYKTVRIEPTCTEQGYSLHRCDCGYEYKNNFVQPKHDYVLVEYIEPTCETDGRERYKCANCGEEKVFVLQATGHKFGQWIEQEKPTCEKDGFALRQCKRCGKTERKTIDATGHKFGQWIEQEKPTCEKGGFALRQCKNCGKTERKTIDATGHNFSEWRQEDDNYVRECSGCSKTERMSTLEYVRFRVAKGKIFCQTQNYKEARDCFLAAANLGDAYSMFKLGLFAEKGLGVDKNLDAAIQWYRLAAEKKNSSACNNLGVIYMQGDWVYPDESLAKEYFEKAIKIDPNNAEAIKNLKILHNRQQERTEAERIQKIDKTWARIFIVIGIFVMIFILVQCIKQ